MGFILQFVVIFIMFFAGILISTHLILSEQRCSFCQTIVGTSDTYCRSCVDKKAETGKIFTWLTDQILWYDVNIANLKNTSAINKPDISQLHSIRRRVRHIQSLVSDIEDVYDRIDETLTDEDTIETLSENSLPQRSVPDVLPIVTIRSLSNKLLNIVDKWQKVIERDNKLDNLISKV